MSSSVSGINGGTPSIMQPIAGPWLSPQVVNLNNFPNPLLAILSFPSAIRQPIYRGHPLLSFLQRCNRSQHDEFPQKPHSLNRLKDTWLPHLYPLE